MDKYDKYDRLINKILLTTLGDVAVYKVPVPVLVPADLYFRSVLEYFSTLDLP